MFKPLGLIADEPGATSDIERVFTVRWYGAQEDGDTGVARPVGKKEKPPQELRDEI
jgi:hypothetical protein